MATKERKIVGSKAGAGVYQNIINVFPEHDIYIECFYGSGAIMQRKKRAKNNIAIDIHFDKTTLLQEDHDIQFFEVDAIAFLSHIEPLINIIHPSTHKVLIYCDPPYPLESRRSQQAIYDFELNKYNHFELLAACRKLPCYVVISSYKNPVYDQELLGDGWHEKSFQTVTRRGKATETIYYNFSDKLTKAEYTYIGNNYRERAAAKGRIERNVAKISRLPNDEFLAVFNTLAKDTRTMF